ncbi:MAG: apolipoprotein N-acyltransferase [Verrucomicrobiota bacterium]
MTKASGWMRLGAAVASGLLVAGAFPPVGFAWLVWVGMLPLLWALWSVEGKRTGWKGFGIGYLAGLAACLVQFNWVASVSWLGALVLPMYLAVYWGLFGWFAATIGKPRKDGGAWESLRVAFCHGAVWAGCELLRGWVITGISWNVLGTALGEARVLAQGADLLGVAGLSLVLVFFQASLMQAGQGFFAGRPKWCRTIGIAGLLVLSLYGYGKFRISLEAKGESVRLKTLLVQLNIPQEAARVLWTDLETHQAYEDETLKALDALKSPDGNISPQWPDWVMWPECALTGRILRTNDGEWGTWQINMDTISQVRQAGPFSLIYGVNELEAVKKGEELVMKEKGRAYNSIAVMSPSDELQTYRKRHLVIFGETIPFVDSIPWLKKIYEQQSGAEYNGSFTPGDSLEPLPIPVGETVIGAIPTVCFEDSVPRLNRKFVRTAPQVIINVTNDGWFKESSAAAQHFAYARFRAIELRRPMLRCANTGVSAAIDSTGSTVNPDTGEPQILTDANGSHFTRGSLLTELKVPLQPTFSLYAVIGDWGILALAMAGLLVPILSRSSAVPSTAGPNEKTIP